MMNDDLVKSWKHDTLRDIKGVWEDEHRKELCHKIWSEMVSLARSWSDEEIRQLFREQHVRVEYDNDNHQIVRWLEESANKLKCPNLHVGLTSSDVEENARLLQIVESQEVITNALFVVKRSILSHFSGRWLARTHLQSAGVTNKREKMWIRCLWARFQEITPKTPAGITGAHYEMTSKLVSLYQSIPWTKVGFNGDFSDESCRQGTGTRQEMDYANVLCFLSAGIVKICEDFRLLHMTEEVIGSDGTASSSGPSKRNPTKFERAQSVASTVAPMYLSIWEAAAHDGLEGTLNRRWILDHVLEDMSVRIVDAVCTLKEAFQTCKKREVSHETSVSNHSSILLTDKVMKGQNRDAAYNELYNSHKKNYRKT